MAKGRFLSKRLGMSEKIAKTQDRPCLVYCLSYPHADRDGRLPFDHKDLAAMCFPRIMLEYRWTLPDIISGRDQLIAIGLWLNRGEYVEIVDFAENQEGMRYDREAPSIWDTPQICGPTPQICGPSPEDSGNPVHDRGSTPAQVQGQVQVKDQGKGESNARSRVEASPEPEPSASYEEKRHPLQKLSGMQELESGLIAPRVKTIWTEVHPRGLRYGFSDFDDRAIGQFSHAIPESDKELQEFFRKCIAAGCKTLEQALRKLNDATFMTATTCNGKKGSAYDYFVEKEGGKLEF